MPLVPPVYCTNCLSDDTEVFRVVGSITVYKCNPCSEGRPPESPFLFTKTPVMLAVATDGNLSLTGEAPPADD